MTDLTSMSPQIAAWLNHIRVLAVDIGPRGSTRPGEREAARYAMEQFKKKGLQPVLEIYISARSIFHPHLLASSLMLLAFVLFPLGGRITAILATLLSLFAVLCELLELSFHNNPFRWMVPKGESQNVYATIPPAGEHIRDLVLVGHLDSQRTPIIFSTQRWIKVYNYLTTITFITFVLQIILYGLAIFLLIPWVWYATIPAAVCAIFLAAMCIHAEATPFTAGANDNASGASLVLAMAEELVNSPLQHCRVFAVCTGCEEVQHYGMLDFYQRHQASLKHPIALVFEMLGCASPSWVVKEGIIVPFKADQNLVQITEHLASEHPEWDAHPTVIHGGNTEMSDALRCKIPAITITGTTRDGVSPYWHQLEDTFDKMNTVEMEKAWQMILTMIHKLDIA